MDPMPTPSHGWPIECLKYLISYFTLPKHDLPLHGVFPHLWNQITWSNATCQIVPCMSVGNSFRPSLEFLCHLDQSKNWGRIFQFGSLPSIAPMGIPKATLCAPPWLSKNVQGMTFSLCLTFNFPLHLTDCIFSLSRDTLLMRKDHPLLSRLSAHQAQDANLIYIDIVADTPLQPDPSTRYSSLHFCTNFLHHSLIW